MGKNHAQRIVILDSSNASSLYNIVNEFHVQVIERELNQLPLTTDQKIAVIDKIIETLKLREVNGIIS